MDQAEERHRAESAAHHPPTQAEHRRVLVVDDNADVASTMATFLELEGHEVRTANSGKDALHVVNSWHPDAMLLDIGMPSMDGYELCRAIRARGDEPQPLLVACTGWGQPEDRKKSRAAGFDAHLVKPVDPDAILHLLGQLDIAPHQA